MSVVTNLRCRPARPGHRWGSERLSRRQFYACPVAPHRHGDSVGLCKRGGFNLFLPLFLHKHLVPREKSPFRTRGRGIYANSPARYRNRRRPRKAEGWEHHLLRRAVTGTRGTEEPRALPWGEGRAGSARPEPERTTDVTENSNQINGICIKISLALKNPRCRGGGGCSCGNMPSARCLIQQV